VREKTIAVTSMAVLLISASLIVGCIGGSITGSGNLTTQTFNYSDFTKVTAHNGFQVELNRSNTFSIEVTADDNVNKYIEVIKSGETLEIGLEFGRSYRSVTLIAKIKMPDLYNLDLSGGSQASITGFSSSRDFSAQLSGGSQLSGDITAADASFDLSGGSQIHLTGSADNLDVNSSGGSQLTLESFPVNNADINISGGGRATVNVSGTLNVNLSGGSKVIYIGEPTPGDIDLSGGSSLNRK
jgi:hypothetical protein